MPSGELHRPTDVCIERFRLELQYWQVPETLLSPCCQEYASFSRSTVCEDINQETPTALIVNNHQGEVIKVPKLTALQGLKRLFESFMM